MVEATGREEDLEHMISNLRRLFRISLESLESVEEALRDPQKARDLSAQTSLAEHLKDTIYSEALFFIAKWQPLGRTLLYVESLIKVSYDLFRVTRYANEIMLTLELAGKKELDHQTLEAAGKAREMLEKAFQAFTQKKPELARGVEELDSSIDKMYYEALRRIATREEVSCGEALEALILRQLERVADHATYIARETLRAIGEASITI